MLAISSSVRWIAIFCVALCSMLPVHSQTQVHEVTIRSHWGGLGPRADATVVITRSKNLYKRDD
jgi:hypothetical protein